MASPSLFVIVSGFGAPNVSEKLAILRKNLELVRRGPWSRVYVRVCVYDDAVMDAELVATGVDDVVRERGVVGDFLRRHAQPKDVEQYDYILCLLDDVELQVEGWDWQRLLRIKADLGLDIVAPSLTLDSAYVYDYMLTTPSSACTVKIGPACEYFCYFMETRRAWPTYHAHLDAHNPWGWGLDLLLNCVMGLRVGRLNHMLVRHHYQGKGYSTCPELDPYVGLAYLLAKHGKTREELSMLPATTYFVI